MKFPLGTRDMPMALALPDEPRLRQAWAYMYPLAPIHAYEFVELNELAKLWVIGSPGRGKSNFLGRFTDACIANGDGVILHDPKGDLARDVAANTRYADRLIYISIGGPTAATPRWCAKPAGACPRPVAKCAR